LAQQHELFSPEIRPDVHRYIHRKMNTIRTKSHAIRKLGIGLGAASLLMVGLLALKGDRKPHPTLLAVKPSIATTELARRHMPDAGKLDQLANMIRIRQRLLQIQPADGGRSLPDLEELQLGTDKFDVLFNQPILRKDDQRAIFIQNADYSAYLKVDQQGYVVDEDGLPLRSIEMAKQNGMDISSSMDPSLAPGMGREGMEPLPPELLDFAVIWTPDFIPENVSGEFVEHIKSHIPDIRNFIARTGDAENFRWPPAP